MFVPSEMKAINVAAKSLCEWVHAVNNYTDVYAEIKQKKDNCKNMDNELHKANMELQQKQAVGSLSSGTGSGDQEGVGAGEAVL